MLFIVGAVFGAILATIFWVYGQFKLEQGYVEQGIAKINMKWYSIVPLNIEYKTMTNIKKGD